MNTNIGSVFLISSQEGSPTIELIKDLAGRKPEVIWVGKNDFIEAKATVASMPIAVRKSLTATQEETLAWLTFFPWYQSCKTGVATLSCSSPMVWIAGKVGVSTRTIKAHVRKLAALGLITKYQPRIMAGTWYLNVYTLTGPLIDAVRGRMGRLKTLLSRHRGKGASLLEKDSNVYKRNRASFAQKQDQGPVCGDAYKLWVVPDEWKREKRVGESLSVLAAAAIKG